MKLKLEIQVRHLPKQNYKLHTHHFPVLNTNYRRLRNSGCYSLWHDRRESAAGSTKRLQSLHGVKEAQRYSSHKMFALRPSRSADTYSPQPSHSNVRAEAARCGGGVVVVCVVVCSHSYFTTPQRSTVSGQSASRVPLLLTSSHPTTRQTFSVHLFSSFTYSRSVGRCVCLTSL